MQVERIDHVHFAVRDIEGAIEFWSNILGTKFSGLMEFKGEDKLSQNWNLRSVMSPLGIEILQGIDHASVISRFVERRGQGIHAIAFKVPDIESAISELQARGLRLVGKVDLGTLKEAQFHPKDSFGVMIELTEYEDVHGAVVHGYDRLRVTQDAER